jgi:diphthamide biosynthesis protein 7
VAQLSMFLVSVLFPSSMLQPGKATSLAYVDTELSADCIEFCPFENYQDIYVCGTYQVLAPDAEPKSTPPEDESDDDEAGSSSAPPAQTRRTGRLLLFQVGDDQQSV